MRHDRFPPLPDYVLTDQQRHQGEGFRLAEEGVPSGRSEKGVFPKTYGFPRLPILLRLEESGLIRRREGSNNYGTVRSRMRLIRSDIDGSNQADLK